MYRLVVLPVLAFLAFAVSAQVEFVKRSDMWAHELGKSIGQGAAAHDDFKGYMRGRDERYARLQELKQKAAACGKCADQARLSKEATTLEAKLTEDDRRLCRGFESQSDVNPAVGAMSKLLGVAPICEKMQAKSTIDSAETWHQANRAEFTQKVKTGDVTAYGVMGQQTMNTFRHLPMQERQARACPYWQEGSLKGDGMSTQSLAQLCQDGSAKAALAAKGSGMAPSAPAAATAGTESPGEMAQRQARNRAAADAKHCEETTQGAFKIREAADRAPAHQAKFNALRISQSEKNRDQACARSQESQKLAASK